MKNMNNVPALYSAATCWKFAVASLRFAHMAALDMRMARRTNKDTTTSYEFYKQQLARAAVFYTVYSRRIAGAPIVDAPAVDYTVWDY